MSCLFELKLVKFNIKTNCKQPKLIYTNWMLLGKVHLYDKGGMKILRGGGESKNFRHSKGGL